MKKILILVFFVSLCFLVTGCRNDNYQVKTCTRNVEAGENMKTDFSYKIYYKGKYVMLFESTEEIEAEDDILNKYKDAYEKVYEEYKGIDYYDHKLTLEDGKLTSKVNIDYRKVDLDKIIELEGNERNIYKDGKVVLKKLLSFYKKAGIQCE